MKHQRKLCSIILCLAALSPVGCTYEKVLYDPWASLRAMSETDKPTVRTTISVSADAETGWAILLESFDGDKAGRRAVALVKRLTTEAKLTDVWVKEAGNKILVLRGHYSGPDSPTAAVDLEQTHATQLDGLTPYENVKVVSLRSAEATGEFDLKRYVGQKLYSLQVAAFDNVYDKDYHKAAEKYAAELRSKGEEAYFYHGGDLSIVTIGLFTDADFEEVERPSPDGSSKFKEKVYGPRMIEIQKKHPLNIFDGYTIKQKQPDGTSAEQPSFIVPVE